jgi:mannose-1-phosphate guanylyltransferase/phosphomannomutase
VGRGSALEKGATLEEGAVLGDDVAVGAGAVINPRVKVYPGRTVEAGAIVTASVVREQRATRSLFGSRGVSGLVNVGVTPLVAVRLGMAYGTALKRGSVVVTGRDSSRAARTMKRALVAGLNASGVTVHDLELVPMPLTRFTIKGEQAAGGISVRTSPGDPEVVEIRLFDGDGADLSPADQRKVERVFFREDYRRAAHNKLGELEFPPRALEQYSAGLIGALDIDAIRSLGPKVVVDYAFGASSLVGPSLMGRLGCDVLAVNAFTDEHRPVLVTADLQKLLANLAEHVRKSGSDLGVLLEPGGETAHLIDDKGRVVAPDRALLAFIDHESKLGAGEVAVPVSCPSACDRVAEAAGAAVTRTPVALPALMSRASRPSVGFAGNEVGELIFPRFLQAPDGLMTFAKTLELLGHQRRPLSDIIDSLPTPHIATRDVRTPWQHKGAVMRHIASSAGVGAERKTNLVLIDGVKVVESPTRWALVIPYPDEPMCRVWAEGDSASDAEEIADRYAAAVTHVVEGEGREG